MPAYISEFNYYGLDPEEFVEIAVPTGTDVSSYSVTIYMGSGAPYLSFPLGSSVATMNGHDIYLIDAATPGFDSSGDPTGVFYPDDAIALSDGSSVLQFVSYMGNTVTATSGVANGMTSTDVGSVGDFGRSLQSDDGGATYFEQTNQNQGSIPACYGAGVLIDTPIGPRAVETLCKGDIINTEDGPQPILWRWTGQQAIEGHGWPILIRKGTLGKDQPFSDLMVSPQHRMLLGDVLVPVKALTGLRGIREMRGKRKVTWFHFACAGHHIVRANGAASESLLLGPMIVASLPRRTQIVLRARFGSSTRTGAFNGPPARKCLTVRQTRERLAELQEERAVSAL